MSNPNGLSPAPDVVAPAAPPTPRPRGGRRAGAGAPKGNANALKHGLYSKRVHYVALLIAAVPEFKALFTAMQRVQAHPERVRLTKALAGAASIVIHDRELAKSIRALTANRVETALDQIQAAHPSHAFADNEQTIRPPTIPSQADLAEHLQAMLDLTRSLVRHQALPPQH